MPDTKITALTAIGANPIIPATFPIPMVDLTDTSMAASGTTKKVTVNQILGAGGTATLASATISGDLTVDTNVLKVDSANNRVGVLNTPTVPFEVTGLIAASGSVFQAGAANGIFAGLNNDGTNPGLDLRRWTGTANNHGTAYIATSSSGDVLFYTDTQASNTKATSLRMTLNSTGLGLGVSSPSSKFHVDAGASSEYFRGAGNSGASRALVISASTTTNTGDTHTINAGSVTGVLAFAIGGSEAMRLNSTGLGVGGSPADGRLLTIGSLSSVSATASAINIYSNKATFNITTDGATNAAGTTISYSWANGGQGSLIFRNAAIANVMTLDSAGNVGVGVTPSAWGAAFKAIEFGTIGSISSTGVATRFSGNSYNNGTNFIYKASSVAACLYEMNAGEHRFSVAPSGTAGNVITFTQAMTLDASGNLLVGTTSAGGSSSNATALVFGGARTASGSVSAATAVATTIFSITAALTGRYEVVALVGFSGAPAQYTAIATIIWDGNGSRVVANNGTNLTITISGSNVQITQTSGSTQTVSWSFLRIAL